MAELFLKVKRDNAPDPAYQDGDIIVAMNDRRIKDVHAQHICHHKNTGFNSSGLRPPISLLYEYLSRVYQYRFDVVSKTEIKRTTLSNSMEEIISDKPNVSGEYIDVGLYLERQLSNPNHLIFGSPGSEFWFGGDINADHTALDLIWQEIENRTIFKKIDHTHWPFTPIEMKSNLAIKVDDFTDTESATFVLPIFKTGIDPETYIGNPIEKRRKYQVPWKDSANLSPMISDIMDSSKTVDTRKDIILPKDVFVIDKTVKIKPIKTINP